MSAYLKYTGGNVCPPDKFRFTCPHCGYHLTPCFDLESLLALVKKHYADNDHPLPTDWREQAEDQLCQLLPPGWCMYGDGTEPMYHVDARMGAEDALRGTKVMLELTRQAIAFKWFGGESPLVTQKEAQRRARICAACHFNASIQGCFGCMGIANLVAEIAGSISTDADGQLRSCLICRCSNLAQTRVSSKILKMGVPGEIGEMFKLVEHCWKREILNELTEQPAESTNPAA